MAKLKALTKTGFNEFVEECFKNFALRSVVESNDEDINEYVLDVDYKTTLAFDTTEIVKGVMEET